MLKEAASTLNDAETELETADSVMDAEDSMVLDDTDSEEAAEVMEVALDSVDEASEVKTGEAELLMDASTEVLPLEMAF